jgi:signal transduction histidine kinase
MLLRMTFRLRLTLLLSALFLCTGGILLGLNYALVRYRLQIMPLPTVRPSDAPSLIAPANGAAPSTPQAPQPPTPPPEEIAQLRALQEQIVAASLRELVIQSGLALMLMVVVVVWLSWAIAGRVLQPVQRITAVAQRLSEQQLHQRIALQGPQDELKELADTFDRMLDRLERAFASQQRFAASASHELRTPLTIMRTEIDVTLADSAATADDLRAMAEILREATDRSERLIDGLLTLARSEQIVERYDVVDLAALAAAAVRQLAPQAHDLALHCETSLVPVQVQGDAPLIERMVANLVENAVRHNQAGGWVRVGVGAESEWVRLIVENSGPLIGAAAVEELFLPFRRGHGERVGSARGAGLGLTIVRAIAKAHAGTVTAKARDSGGLQVELRLPLAPQPDV